MARHKAHPFAPWLLLSLTACGSWPRFAHPHEAPPPFTTFPTILQLVEDPQRTGADFPPGPPPAGQDGADFVAPTHKPLELDQLFGAAQVLGTISGTEGLKTRSVEPFAGSDCGPDINFGISGIYSGDVDFIRANVATSGLCLVLSSPPEPEVNARAATSTTGDTGTTDTGPTDGGPTDTASPQGEEAWDILVLQTKPDGSCFASSFLTRHVENNPDQASQVSMPGTNFAALPSGEALGPVLVMVTLATESLAPRPYSLHLLPTRNDPRSCTDAGQDKDGDGLVDDLTEENFGPYRGTP